jgi:hypothetical protein
MVRLEGLGQLKNPMTSTGIEPATFNFKYYFMEFQVSKSLKGWGV